MISTYLNTADFPDLLSFDFPAADDTWTSSFWDTCPVAFMTQQHFSDTPPTTSLMTPDLHYFYPDIKYWSSKQLGLGPSSLLTLQSWKKISSLRTGNFSTHFPVWTPPIILMLLLHSALTPLVPHPFPHSWQSPHSLPSLSLHSRGGTYPEGKKPHNHAGWPHLEFMVSFK